MSNKYEEANLILKLYELRREKVMREARQWFFLNFNPDSVEEVKDILVGENSGRLRMVLSYWDMAAALVNSGAISPELFDETHGEHLALYAKMEPLLPGLREFFAPLEMLANVEKLIDGTKGGRERVVAIRELTKRQFAVLAEKRKRLAAQEAAKAASSDGG